MARNNEPAFRRKTPLLICSIRTEIPYPCIGSSANVFRMSISSVPWTRSLGLSAIKTVPLDNQEENTPLILFVKRRTRRECKLAGELDGDQVATEPGVMLLGVGAVGAVFLELVVERFQADAEKFGGARLIVSRGAEGLQDEFPFHGIHGGAHGK